MVTMCAPRACASPAITALCSPKFRARLTTVSATWLRWQRSRQTSSELSGLPSLTSTISRPPGTSRRVSSSTKVGTLSAPL